MMPPSAAAIPNARPARESLLRRVRRLTREDWLGVSQAAWLLCRVAVTLRRSDFIGALDQFHLREVSPPAPDARIARAAQLVRWAHRVVPLQPNCLLDSLTAAAWLRCSGLAAPLSIGVKMNGGALEAHAWLGQCRESAENFRLLYQVPVCDAPPERPA